MERHFSTSDAVDAGEGGGGAGIKLACVCFAGSLDGFDLHGFHPLQGFQRGQRKSTEKRDNWVRKRSRLLAEETEVALSC